MDHQESNSTHQVSQIKLYERIVRVNNLIDLAEDNGWPCGNLKKEWRTLKKQLDKRENP